MKKAALFFASIFISFVAFCQTDSAIAIVPQPVKVIRKTGYFILPKNITINSCKTTALKQTAADSIAATIFNTYRL